MLCPVGTPVTGRGPDQETDAVDTLVCEWRQERPDLDTSPLEVLSRVSRLAKHLERRRARIFSSHGLDLGTFDVLAVLRRSGPPYELTPGLLLGPTLVTSGTMTNRVDRLEEMGLVERRADERDRRGVLVRLTRRGRARVDTCLVELLSDEENLLGGIGGPEREELAALLRSLLIRLEAGSFGGSEGSGG
jgi:DNA-binding MarR family transcriptional regulator